MKGTKIALLMVLVVAAATLVASAQNQIFVPSDAAGYFGQPVDKVVPFVPAVTVSGPATMTVTYVSGTVNWDGSHETGPDGSTSSDCCRGMEFPLDEAKGIGRTGTVHHLAGLIGVFVPQARVDHPGFSALDATKNQARFGIIPGCSSLLARVRPSMLRRREHFSWASMTRS